MSIIDIPECVYTCNTANELYKCIENDFLPNNDVIADYFGIESLKSSHTLNIIYGIYKGLYLMEVPISEISRCFKSNRLDELIHTKYRNIQSKYYEDFYKNNITIGNTYMCSEYSNNKHNIKNFKIYPTLSIIGTIYNNFNIKQNIIKKILGYISQDKKKGFNIPSNYIKTEDVFELLKRQENRCYVCKNNVLLSQYHNHCLYQFTLDRINDKIPHIKDNVLISCYYCNCFGWENKYNKFNVPQKICTDSDEHCYSRDIRYVKRSKYDVGQDEIEIYKLNTN